MDMSSDYVVAMNAPQYDSYDWCNVEIDIQYKGKTVKAKVVDRVRRSILRARLACLIRFRSAKPAHLVRLISLRVSLEPSTTLVLV